MSPRQTMSLGETLLQLLFRFIVNTLYGAYLPRSYVGSDGLLRQHFPENLLSLLLLLKVSRTPCVPSQETNGCHNCSLTLIRTEYCNYAAYLYDNLKPNTNVGFFSLQTQKPRQNTYP